MSLGEKSTLIITRYVNSFSVRLANHRRACVQTASSTRPIITRAFLINVELTDGASDYAYGDRYEQMHLG